MDFDADFDGNRLKQLAQEYLTGNKAVGQVIFSSESDENRLDYATWRFEDDDYEALKESGFKFLLMELLDTLIIYRNQCQQPNASAGVVTVSGSELSIEWLPAGEAQAIRDKGPD